MRAVPDECRAGFLCGRNDGRDYDADKSPAEWGHMSYPHRSGWSRDVRLPRFLVRAIPRSIPVMCYFPPYRRQGQILSKPHKDPALLKPPPSRTHPACVGVVHVAEKA